MAVEIVKYQKIKPDFGSYKPELSKICRTFGVKKLMTFGSVNTDKFSPESDIDFLVVFSEPEKIDLFSLYFGLKDQLEKLFKRPVEIVIDRNFKNPFFKKAVNQTKRVIYEV